MFTKKQDTVQQTSSSSDGGLVDTSKNDQPRGNSKALVIIPGEGVKDVSQQQSQQQPQQQQPQQQQSQQQLPQQQVDNTSLETPQQSSETVNNQTSQLTDVQVSQTTQTESQMSTSSQGQATTQPDSEISELKADQFIEMGFSKELVDRALKKFGTNPRLIMSIISFLCNPPSDDGMEDKRNSSTECIPGLEPADEAEMHELFSDRDSVTAYNGNVIRIANGN